MQNISEAEILEKTTELSVYFKCLGDTNRVRILLALLSKGEQNVNQLSCQFPDISRPTVSHHLSLMKNSGLIKCRKDGVERYYDITCEDFTSKLNCWIKIINKL
ncbi:MAG: metalloregulator ArsR/SmtB family transcription factor [Oscillospiraceae bacterium]